VEGATLVRLVGKPRPYRARLKSVLLRDAAVRAGTVADKKTKNGAGTPVTGYVQARAPRDFRKFQDDGAIPDAENDKQRGLLLDHGTVLETVVADRAST